MSTAKTPILNGVAQGDIDMQGYKLLNLDLSSLASGAPFNDDTALVANAVDRSKLAHFDLSLVGSGAHRVFQLPNYNGRLATVAGVEDLSNKTYNGITLSGTGGFSLTDAIVALTGGLITNGDLDLGSGHQLILDTTADTHLILPVDGTLATTAQLPTISDVAYNATSWNGNLDGATKNALRDKFESLSQDLPPFSDEKSILKNASDDTKLVKFDLSALSTATTRTLAVPDKDGTLAMLDDLPDFAGILFDADEDDRQLYLAGNVGFFGPFTLAGGFLTRFNVSAATELDLPVAGTLATTDQPETFTNKTIEGGTVTSLEKFTIRSTGAAHDLEITTAASLTSDRQLILALGDANRTLTLGNNFSTSGNFPITLQALASSNVILPSTGTLVADVGVPANSSDSGTEGQRAIDSDFLYIAVGTNTWKRIALESW